VTIYTESGLGKSTFCSQVKDILLVPNVQAGLRNIKGYKYDIITHWDGYKTVLQELKNEKHSYRAVCLDTITEMRKMAADAICRKYNVPHETDLPGDNNKGYTLINNEFFRLIKEFYGLGLGLYMTAHVREEKQKTKTQEWLKAVPDLPGKSRADIIAISDIVLYGDSEEYEDDKDDNKKKTRRILHTRPNTYWVAKDRFSVLPEPIPLSYNRFMQSFIEGMKQKKLAVEHTGNAGTSNARTNDKTENKLDNKAENKNATPGAATTASPKK